MLDLQSCFGERHKYYEKTILTTIDKQTGQISDAIDLLVESLRNGFSVRFLGAGRARLVAAVPANRLCHAGANVSIISDTIPMPNTRLGGFVFAVSASGTSIDVINAMEKARKRRDAGAEEGGRIIKPITIPIVGISALTGKDKYQKLCDRFQAACDVFIHIQVDTAEKSDFNHLGDNEEHVIMELLDFMVACAINITGRKNEILHEDLGPTGEMFAIN